MSLEIRDMLAMARNYCHLIEHCDSDRWLLKVADLLPQMHAAIARIESAGMQEEGEWQGVAIDLDRRFNLYVELKSLLGENDPYWLEYDFDNDLQHMSGSLADDLTDIYYELKQGLDQLSSGPEPSPDSVLKDWRKGYHVHWGQHLLDAERHLYVLDQEGRL